LYDVLTSPPKARRVGSLPTASDLQKLFFGESKRFGLLSCDLAPRRFGLPEPRILTTCSGFEFRGFHCPQGEFLGDSFCDRFVLLTAAKSSQHLHQRLIA
jgi:hypothetical protein